ncbi:MAG: TetR/AcrR family transcriptional regulator [Acidobacteriota bacterium]
MASFAKPPTLNDDQRAVDIYRAAAKIIRTKGYDATSMGDIAEAVDLTKGGLYYYIKGKEALLFAIMSFAAGCLESRVLQPADGVDDPEERLATLISKLAELMIDEPSAMVVLADEEERLNVEHRPRITERKERFAQSLRVWVGDVLEARGGDSHLDTAVAAASLLALVEGVVRWFDPAGAISRAEAVNQVTRMALQSLEPLTDRGRRAAVA